jgi:N-acetylglutamate synthase-like GNAT family acetyltransferase
MFSIGTVGLLFGDKFTPPSVNINAHCGAISNIITRNLIEVNSKDYGLEEMIQESLKYTPDKIATYAKFADFILAYKDRTIVGVLRVERNPQGNEHDYVFLNVAVLPEYHGNNIGTELVESAERIVHEFDGQTIKIPAISTAYGFFEKLDYEYINGKQPDSNGHIWLNKNRCMFCNYDDD